MTVRLGEWTFEELRDQLVRAGVARTAAEAEARRQLGIPSAETIQAKELEASAIEDKHVAEGDRRVRALGGKVVAFSQKRASKQTPGIPDRKYYFPHYGITFWWEAKAEWGVQSPAQKDFEAMAVECGEHYLLGDLSVLTDALANNYLLCTINPDGSLEPVRQPEA